MKHWSRSFALLTVLLGIVGQGSAIASSTGNRGEGTLQTSPSISSKRQSANFELAQVQGFGRRGDCRQTTKEMPLFERSIPTNNIRETLRRGTEVILLQDSGRGIDYIEVQVRRSRSEGYVDTSNLIPCSSSPISVLPARTPIPGNCLKITSAKIDFRNGPGFNYPLVEPLHLYENEEVTITGTETQDLNGLVWVPVLTRFGDYRGWIVLGTPRDNRYNALSCS